MNRVRLGVRWRAGFFTPVLLLAWIAVVAAADSQVLEFDFSRNPLDQLERNTATELSVFPVPQPPVVDAQLDETLWRDAALLILDAAPGLPRMEARFCYDDRNLYLGIRRQALPGSEVQAVPAARDAAAAYHGECVELWFASTSYTTIQTYQFVLNAAGACFDARQGKAAYNPEWRHAAAIADNAWTAEIAIPKQAIGLTTWDRQLAFNFGHNAPGMAPRPWVGEYGQLDAGVLVLEGISHSTAGGASTVAPTRDRELGPALETTGQGLLVTAERSRARPGDRYVELNLALDTQRVPLEHSRVEAALARAADGEIVARAAAVPEYRRGRLRVDLRAAGTACATLHLQLLDRERVVAAAATILTAEPPVDPFRASEKIAVRLDLPPGLDRLAAWPITVGVPFAAGQVWDARSLRLVDQDGRELPQQQEVTGRWAPDGAVQWIRFDALADSDRGCFVEVARPSGAVGPVLTLQEDGDRILIDTGVAEYVLAKGASPIREVRRKGRIAASSEGTRGLYVVDQNNRTASASADGETLQIEARGPVAACVRFEGFYRTSGGETLAAHITRVELFAGHPFAKVNHTLVITEDTNRVWFKEIGWEFAVGTGPEPKAMFGCARDNRSEVAVQALAGNTAAFMMQDRHYRFRHGENHGYLAFQEGMRQPRVLREVTECGDWGALTGREGGWLAHCREAARQHPKEFLVTRERVVLKLFSDRAGEQLDFRLAALVPKWDLARWHRALNKSTEEQAQQYVQEVLGYSSNAVGWSKTHELTFSPLAPGAGGEETARQARVYSERFYAHVDPQQVYRSEVMGRLHPTDPERFPDAEKAIETVWRFWEQALPTFGDFGFMDYCAGPHCAYVNGYPALMRYGVTYTLIPDLWLTYARCGARAKRVFAENVTRAFTDNYLNHWERAEKPTKARGLLTQLGAGGGKYGLPLYWEPAVSVTAASTTNLNQLVWMYQFTGCRRARDVVVQYGEGVKQVWRASLPKSTWRPVMLLRTLSQVYALTHDRTVRAMADAVTDFLHDPESELRLNKDKVPNDLGVTYKLVSDQEPLVEAYEIFGTERLREMATRVGEYRWIMDLAQVVGYNIKTPYVGSFLYARTRQPDIADWMAVKLRLAPPQFCDLAKGEPSYHGTRAHETCFLFRLPYAMDVVARTDADRNPLTTWMGYIPAGAAAKPIVRKGEKERIDLVALNMKTVQLEAGVVTRRFGGNHDIRLHRDNAAGDYAITPGQCHASQILAGRGKARMVLHAPEYWEPYPALEPSPSIYFKVPENAVDAQVFFERDARLFTPAGAAFRDRPVRGLIDLSAGPAGLWRFQLEHGGLVRVRNLPPFFAFGEAASYFEPDIPWRRESAAPRVSPPPPPDQAFAAGVTASPADQALFLRRGQHFTVKRAETRELQVPVLPTPEGTIEFFFRPWWSSVEFDRPRVSVIDVETDREPWQLQYMLNPRRYELWAEVPCDGEQKRMPLRSRRAYSLFERERWVHIAWVWGLRHQTRGREGGLRPRDNVLVTRLFVDGRAGAQSDYLFWGGNQPLGTPTALVLGDFGGGAFDELRVSVGMRYWEDFQPPPRAAMQPDPDTLMLFHFNGGVQPEGIRADALNVGIE